MDEKGDVDVDWIKGEVESLQDPVDRFWKISIRLLKRFFRELRYLKMRERI